MRIRKNILPRRLIDIVCFLVIGVFLPIIFIFEIVIVLPAFHEPGGFLHTFTFALAMFLVFNIKSNMIACMLVDTSVRNKSLRPPPMVEGKGWFYCKRCDLMAPPRSHHCKVCRTCVLKCDHHCLFTGCCVGHYNHRYFIMFVFYLFIGATYAFVYNSIYLWVLKASTYRNILSLWKIICPALMFAIGSPWNNLHLVFYSLNFAAVVFSITLLIYHGQVVLNGGVSYERKRGYRYNAGWKRNFEVVFGKRMHLVWLSPLIVSELPDDGYCWEWNDNETESEIEEEKDEEEKEEEESQSLMKKKKTKRAKANEA